MANGQMQFQVALVVSSKLLKSVNQTLLSFIANFLMRLNFIHEIIDWNTTFFKNKSTHFICFIFRLLLMRKRSKLFQIIYLGGVVVISRNIFKRVKKQICIYEYLKKIKKKQSFIAQFYHKESKIDFLFLFRILAICGDFF